MTEIVSYEEREAAIRSAIQEKRIGCPAAPKFPIQFIKLHTSDYRQMMQDVIDGTNTLVRKKEQSVILLPDEDIQHPKVGIETLWKVWQMHAQAIMSTNAETAKEHPEALDNPQTPVERYLSIETRNLQQKMALLMSDAAKFYVLETERGLARRLEEGGVHTVNMNLVDLDDGDSETFFIFAMAKYYQRNLRRHADFYHIVLNSHLHLNELRKKRDHVAKEASDWRDESPLQYQAGAHPSDKQTPDMVREAEAALLSEAIRLGLTTEDEVKLILEKKDK